jgi:SP family general alpha glucoside:H+ symporter-like MFS transporter
MSIIQGVRLYPKAIGFAAGIAMACAMEGYQICLIGNYYAFPPFNQKYGELQPDGTYQVPARWQSGLSNLAQCGQIIGLLRE